MQEQMIPSLAASQTVRPFVKWAGGKRQLIPVLSGNMPKTFERYFEPFLGGGAFFLHIATAASGYPDLTAYSGENTTYGKKHSYHISDLNEDLVMSYRTIRDSPDDLVESLARHEKRYQNDSESYYYHIRNDYDAEHADAVETVSRMLFLNRTCFNGLYRVNRSGKFNVPLGRYKNPNITNSDTIHAVSRLLNTVKVEISCRDFGDVARRARKGDFVYFDPPYMPVSQTASFTQYTGCDFGIDDQQRLADLCVKLGEMGCMVMLSNSDSGVISEMFARDEWTVMRVNARRNINSDAGKRTGHTELLVKNY